MDSSLSGEWDLLPAERRTSHSLLIIQFIENVSFLKLALNTEGNVSFTNVEILCPLRGTGSELAAVARGDLEATREELLAGSWHECWLVQRTADQCY